tara:strand:+ start:597 stop:1454 length:858 start_codon:yes stop_codon:yes gene_type:complete
MTNVLFFEQITMNEAKSRKDIQDSLLVDDLKYNSSGYQQIFILENKLRYFIYTTLSKDKVNWWKSIGDPGVRDRALNNIKNECSEKRKKQRAKSGKNFQLMHEIYYTTLDDLWKIINGKWDSFSIFFGINGRKDLENRFKRTVSIRNQVMHSNLISSTDFEDLKAFNNFLDDRTPNPDMKFLKTFNENQIMSDFKDELQSHLAIFDSFEGEKLRTGIFHSFKDEWWYIDYLEIDHEKCNQYYNKIDHANKIIDKRYRNMYAEVSTLFNANDLNIKCSQILSQINE